MRPRHLIAAWLSLFAMLMIFAGPLISQGVSIAHGQRQPMNMAGMACDDMPGMSMASHQPPASNNHHLLIWEKCGYCSLLFQHPPLHESNLLSVIPGFIPAIYLSSHISPQQPAPPVFPGARSRAPPV